MTKIDIKDSEGGGGGGQRASSSKSPSPARREAGVQNTKEAARCIAARALAVYNSNTDEALSQMRTAISMGRGDAVVLALAKQLDDHLASVRG